VKSVRPNYANLSKCQMKINSEVNFVLIKDPDPSPDPSPEQSPEQSPDPSPGVVQRLISVIN